MTVRSGSGTGTPWPERPVLALADLTAFDPHAAAGGAKRRFCCPLPACQGKPVDAAHRSLEVETATGFWRCYRCGGRGRLQEHWQPRLPRRLAARRAFGLEPSPSSSLGPAASLRPQDGRAAGTDPQAAPVCVPFDWRGAYTRAPSLAAAPTAAAYLTGRGIAPALADAAGVRAAPRWYGRPAVLFPIRDRAGEVVAVSGRCLDGRAPKALTGGQLSGGVFLTPGALVADPLVITEAPIDALSLAVCGVPAVALGGTRWPAWLPQAVAFRQVVIATDADQAGDAAAAKIADALRAFGARVERWRPDAGKDWNELLQAYGLERLRVALFAQLAGPLYRAVRDEVVAAWDGHPPRPHPELEAAIDACDWPAFCRELPVWARWIEEPDSCLRRRSPSVEGGTLTG